MGDIENLLSRVSKTGRGVSVQASTLGSLEALLEFLKVSKIPVANISIGPVYKRDVMQCGVMLEKAKEYAVMLCFDVKVDPDAMRYAEEAGVKIFQADIIYHLFDNFTAHMAQLAEQRKEESKMLAVFPCAQACCSLQQEGPNCRWHRCHRRQPEAIDTHRRREDQRSDRRQRSHQSGQSNFHRA